MFIQTTVAQNINIISVDCKEKGKPTCVVNGEETFVFRNWIVLVCGIYIYKVHISVESSEEQTYVVLVSGIYKVHI